MAWNDTWAEEQRRKAAAETHGGLVEHVSRRVVNGVLDDPLHCEDRDFCEAPPDDWCEGPLRDALMTPEELGPERRVRIPSGEVPPWIVPALFVFMGMPHCSPWSSTRPRRPGGLHWR